MLLRFCSYRIAKNGIILKFPPPHALIWLSTSFCCISGCRICCQQLFNFSLRIVCVCPIYSSLQPLQITTQIEFLLSQLNGTLTSNFLSVVFKVCSIPSLMYWQQARFLPYFFTLEIELLDEIELLYNILPKFGVCRLQLINFNFFNAFHIRSEVFQVFQGLFNNRQGFGDNLRLK